MHCVVFFSGRRQVTVGGEKKTEVCVTRKMAAWSSIFARHANDSSVKSFCLTNITPYFSLDGGRSIADINHFLLRVFYLS